MRTNIRGALAGLVRGIPATVLLIVANVGVYAAMTAIDNRAGDASGQAAYLTQWGANVGALTFAGEPWRLLSNMFVHAGFVHLAFNCLALLEIGGVVERRLGAWRMLAIYLLSGLGGSYVSARWHSFTVSIGASGAIFGVLAAVIVFGYLARQRLRGPYGEPVSPGRALLFGALTLALGLFFNFDNAAHIGGFAFGAVLSLFALLAERALRATGAAVLFGAAAIATGTALAVLTVQGFSPRLAAQLRFAQLMAALQAGNTDGQTALRRCALRAAVDLAGAPAEGFAACLRAAASGNAAAPSSATDVANRFGLLLEHNQRVVWPRCRLRADQLMHQPLPAARQAVVAAIARHCDARARIERGALASGQGSEPDPASLRRDLQHVELLAALADRRAPLQLQRLPERETVAQEATVLAQWQASITPEQSEIARLTDCPTMSCRRVWAR